LISGRFLARFTGWQLPFVAGAVKHRPGMARWLIKSEPESYSWDDLVRDSRTEWDGVRNNAARLHLRAMKQGDEAFFYRSLVEPAVVGIVRISRGPGPDPKDPKWVSVEVEPVRALQRPVTLRAIKAESSLAAMELIRQSRLSVAPVRDEEWSKILDMENCA
jgi:predicted RNA-binding protein with PUA-like domain